MENLDLGEGRCSAAPGAPTAPGARGGVSAQPLPTSSAPMWIQVERRCFSTTCDRMLLSRARVSGMWGLKLLGKRSTSRRCWYFSCLRMNCGEEPSGGCPGGTPVIWDGEQDWEPLPPHGQRSAPGEPPPACVALPAAGSAQCPPRWEGRDRLSGGCQGRVWGTSPSSPSSGTLPTRPRLPHTCVHFTEGHNY